MATPKEGVTPNTPAKGASDDEEFFKEHGIDDDETKEGFRQRYLVDKYKDFRKSKETPPPPEKKKRKSIFDSD